MSDYDLSNDSDENYFVNEDSSANDTTASFDGFDMGVSDEAVTPAYEEFPRDLPIRHQYLGNTEEVRGRTILADGEHIKIPILAHCPEVKVALLPGQTLPLTFFDRSDHLLIHTALEKDNIMGILHPQSQRNKSKVYGTTAEICDMHNVEEQGTISIIAKGRQRFQVCKKTSNSNGVTEAIVEILPEVNCSDPLRGHRHPYVQRLDFSFAPCLPNTPQEHRKMQRTKRLRRSNALQTSWPSWVYDMYDPNLLSTRLVSAITTAIQARSEELNIPKTAEDLSFWCAKNLPLPSHARLDVLALDSPIQRLRHLLHITTNTLQSKYVKCVICRSRITNMKKIFAMSQEGPQGTFVNPGGYVHEMITTREVERADFYGAPSEVHSWFPGYSWQIMNCRVCARHLGWKFKAVDSKLIPRKFYGLVHAAIAPERISEFSDVDTVL